MSDLSKRKILLAVSGGIAVYKTCELVRLLRKQDAVVRVMMTQAAQEFVTPLTFQVLSGEAVTTSLFDAVQENAVGHIGLADWADVVIVAPATADILAKTAQGLATDLVSTVLLATKAPILWAPSMNINMWLHPAVQKNVSALREFGGHVMTPDSGELACGWEGMGRLPDSEKILVALQNIKLK